VLVDKVILTWLKWSRSHAFIFDPAPRERRRLPPQVRRLHPVVGPGVRAVVPVEQFLREALIELDVSPLREPPRRVRVPEPGAAASLTPGGQVGRNIVANSRRG